jgi:hypothetical protein
MTYFESDSQDEVRCQTLMVRSAPSRVSNHEASGEAKRAAAI